MWYLCKSKLYTILVQDLGECVWIIIFIYLKGLWWEILDLYFMWDLYNQVIMNYWYIWIWITPKSLFHKYWKIHHILFHFLWFNLWLKTCHKYISLVLIYSTRYNEALIVFWRIWYFMTKYLIYDVPYRSSQKWVIHLKMFQHEQIMDYYPIFDL